MDITEAYVRKYLLANGFTDIVYEPEGKVPPDFVINNSIAIEVTRLNSHYQDTSDFHETYAHQEYFPKVWQGLEKLLKKFGPAIDGESWYVDFSLIHPFKGWSNVKNEVEELLIAFKNSDEKINRNYRILECLSIGFIQRISKSEDYYVLGGGAEDEIGCFVVDEIYRNLEILISKKELKISNYHYKYLEWWLILVDLINWGHTDSDDLNQLRSLPKIKSMWDKVIIISPHDLHNYFEY
ncbi:MAG: hypothetical protein IPN42_00290 [Methylococcaceae bacterium]|nr:hypothetical protein [Methylococcaceae bacterium]